MMHKVTFVGFRGEIAPIARPWSSYSESDDTLP